MSHVDNVACLCSIGRTRVLSPAANTRANISSTIRLILDKCRLFIIVLVIKSSASETQLHAVAGAPGVSNCWR